jgi:DNA-binding NarL/FixJ family response regulator
MSLPFSFPPITLLIADDHVIIRRGLKFLLESHFNQITIYETDTNKGIVTTLVEKPITHMILDMQLQDGNVLEIFQEIKQLKPDVPVLIYTMSPEEIFAKRLQSLGAAGFLNKQSNEEEVVKAMELFFSGRKYISQKQLDIQNTEQKGKSNNPFSNLSEREMEVLLLLLKGKSVKEIASHFELKSNTVATFKARIFDKIGVNNLMDLQNAARAYNIPVV